MTSWRTRRYSTRQLELRDSRRKTRDKDADVQKQRSLAVQQAKAHIQGLWGVECTLAVIGTGGP
eukprot:12111-Pyramimonas_sp.AAC.1